MTSANDVDADTDEIRLTLDEQPAPSVAVVEAVAEATDVDPVNLPPLHDAIDTDALDTLFTDRADGVLAFEYADCEVRVDGTTTVTVTTN